MLDLIDGVDALPSVAARATVEQLLKSVTAQGVTAPDLRDVDEP
jgi:hypothetical protein